MALLLVNRSWIVLSDQIPKRCTQTPIIRWNLHPSATSQFLLCIEEPLLMRYRCLPQDSLTAKPEAGCHQTSSKRNTLCQGLSCCELLSLLYLSSISALNHHLWHTSWSCNLSNCNHKTYPVDYCTKCTTILQEPSPRGKDLVSVYSRLLFLRAKTFTLFSPSCINRTMWECSELLYILLHEVCQAHQGTLICKAILRIKRSL